MELSLSEAMMTETKKVGDNQRAVLGRRDSVEGSENRPETTGESTVDNIWGSQVQPRHAEDRQQGSSRALSTSHAEESANSCAHRTINHT